MSPSLTHLSLRPLTHMCAQQEKKFKEELHEKEQEIVRLHTILRSTEMHMHEHRAASAAKEVELSVLRARLDQVRAEHSLPSLAATQACVPHLPGLALV